MSFGDIREAQLAIASLSFTSFPESEEWLASSLIKLASDCTFSDCQTIVAAALHVTKDLWREISLVSTIKL